MPARERTGEGGDATFLASQVDTPPEVLSNNLDALRKNLAVLRRIAEALTTGTSVSEEEIRGALTMSVDDFLLQELITDEDARALILADNKNDKGLYLLAQICHEIAELKKLAPLFRENEEGVYIFQPERVLAELRRINARVTSWEKNRVPNMADIIEELIELVYLIPAQIKLYAVNPQKHVREAPALEPNDPKMPGIIVAAEILRLRTRIEKILNKNPEIFHKMQTLVGEKSRFIYHFSHGKPSQV